MYSERFKKAIPYVFEHEGKFNNHVEDKGGATNWGISLRFLKSINRDINQDGKIDFFDIKGLTKEQATDLYYDNFWKPLYDKIPYESLAIKLFDTAINMGQSQASKLLQKALNDLGEKVSVDGILGPDTLAKTSAYKESQLLAFYCSEQYKFYQALALKDPSQNKFLSGWKNRANFIPK